MFLGLIPSKVAVPVEDRLGDGHILHNFLFISEFHPEADGVNNALFWIFLFSFFVDLWGLPLRLFHIL